MSSREQIAKHVRDVFTGGNWTSVNLRDTLANVNWEQATQKVHTLNTIAVLVFHINYYVSAVLKVLQGEKLQAHDKYSFDLTPITSEEDWQKLVAKAFAEAELLAQLIESSDDNKLFEVFEDAKYGSYYRNFFGIIEHTHYHLGQIVLIKKIINGQ